MQNKRVYEQVFTVTKYYDGPREGIASFQGRPHYYKSRCNEFETQNVALYDLWLIDDKTVVLALESWSIWRRWEAAFHLGETPIETHPALPCDRNRFDEIEQILAERLAALTDPGATKAAEFRVVDSQEDRQGLRDLEVKWIDAAVSPEDMECG